MNELIKLERVSVQTQQGDILVEPISLQLKKGCNLTILGETGSGKSLLAQAIMGALPSTLMALGEIRIEGQLLDSIQLRQYWGKRLAMLPQEPSRSLDPTMNIFNQVWESFTFVAQESKQSAVQKTQEKLTALGLANFEHYYPHQLSGGMAQRASFAAATAGGAYIVIADEPTKGLDENNKNAVIALLQQIAKQNGALLTITHDIDVAAQLGGEIMVMKKGKLLEQGQAKHILHKPNSEYAKQLIAAAPQHWIAQTKTKLKTDLLCSVKDLILAREGRSLFNPINVEIHRGEIIGLVGDSGIGKSSLGDAICHLLKPKQGEIKWHQQLKRHQVLKLYQDPPAAFAHKIPLRILLDDVIKKHKLDSSRVPDLLTKLNLTPELLQRSAENVSGGELQRIAILRALLFEPALLFADEVTSRLDPITQKETLDLLIEQCRLHHCALILVSHDLHLIEHYCHKVIKLKPYNSCCSAKEK